MSPPKQLRLLDLLAEMMQMKSLTLLLAMRTSKRKWQKLKRGMIGTESVGASMADACHHGIIVSDVVINRIISRI